MSYTVLGEMQIPPKPNVFPNPVDNSIADSVELIKLCNGLLFNPLRILFVLNMEVHLSVFV